MDFELNQSQKDIQKAARDFARGEFDGDRALELDRASEFPRSIWSKAGALGFIGMRFPEGYSGQDFGILEYALAIEQFCREDSTVGCAVALSGHGSECLSRFGNHEMKQRFLPGVAEGRMLSGGAFAEPGQCYGLASIETTAVKEGADWLISGRKHCVINGGEAAFYCVLCRTDSEAKPEKAMSMILVEANREGVSIINDSARLGLRMTPSADLHFEHVRVPSTNVIGKEGDGFGHALELLDESRILMSALAVGTAQGAFERSLDYVRQREAFGKKITDFQITRHKVAEMAARIEQARFMTYQAAWSFDQGRTNPKTTAMTKMVASRIAVEVAGEAIQLLGGNGYMSEYGVERFCRDAKTIELSEGSPELLKSTIADALI